MNKKHFTIWTLIVLIFMAIFVPTANSEEIPLLTWERGKEQNVILGTESNIVDWKIKLVNDNSVSLTFRRSTIGPDGSIVYSLNLPSDLPLGLYSIQTFDSKDNLASIVAGVEVVELETYQITSIPFAFKSLLLFFVFILSYLIGSRNSRVIRITFRRNKSLEEEVIELQKSFLSRIVNRLKRESLNELNANASNLVGFAIRRDIEFSRSLPSFISIGLPVVSLVLGVLAGVVTGTKLPNVPVLFILILALLGIVNFMNGIYGACGFIAAQLIIGVSPNLSSLLILVSIVLGWIICGICADLLVLREQERNLLSFTKTRILSYSIPGIIFIFTQNLANSFTPEIRTNMLLVNLVGILVSIAYTFKAFAQVKIDLKAVEVKQLIFIRLPITGKFLLTFCLVFLLMTYSWSQSWPVSFIACIFLAFSMSLIFVNLTQPQISFLRKIPRNTLVEASFVTALSFGVFETIGQLPFTVDQKSTLYMTLAFIPNALHAIYLNLYDVPIKGEAGDKI